MEYFYLFTVTLSFEDIYEHTLLIDLEMGGFGFQRWISNGRLLEVAICNLQNKERPHPTVDTISSVVILEPFCWREGC